MNEEAIFSAALEKPAHERAAFLASACGGDEALRKRLEGLLAASERAGKFMANPAVSRVQSSSDTEVFDGTDNIAPEDRAEMLAFLAPPGRADSLGRIGHYEVLEVLGQGGFGIVLRAFDDVLQRVVAIKVLAPLLAATSPARKRFLREAQSFAKVRHENIVQIYAIEEKPLPYLVMEFIPGETLHHRLNRIGPLEIADVLRLGRQVAEGLAAAHAMKLIHRDIKPANILIEDRPNDRVKITDFGLARAADDASVTQSGLVAGTPMYMSPEQAKGESIDHRADLFSLGSVIYAMTSGRPPFRAASSLAVLKRVAEDTPRPIKEIIPETPSWLCEFIAKLQAKNPEDRFQSALEVADRVAEFERKLEPATSKEVSAALAQSETKPAARPRSRWKSWAAAVVLIPIAAVAFSEAAGWTRLLKQRAEDQPQLPAPGAALKNPGPKDAVKPVAAPALAIAPFNAEQAKKSQQAWADFLKRPVEHVDGVGIKLRLVPPGKFTMGSSQEEIDRCIGSAKEGSPEARSIKSEGPEHEVEITRPFYLGQTEITVGQFRQFVNETSYKVGQAGDASWLNPGWPQTDDHPVVNVNWNNAANFCKWLSWKEGKTYRLPTEAEWEYSCRAGTTNRYSCGDDEEVLLKNAWVDINSPGKAREVKGFRANPWGLHDMHGNVWELCQDYYEENYYRTSPKQDPQGPATGRERVFRGGSWYHGPLHSRAAYRHHHVRGSDHRYPNLGFRVVSVISPTDVLRQDAGAQSP